MIPVHERAGRRGRVLSVNLGAIRRFEANGREATSAIWKVPAPGRVMTRGVRLEGDAQADPQAHGGFDKAIYAYALEDHRFWEATLARSMEPGGVGENLTTEGLDLTSAVVGDRWRVGDALLEVSEPRVPCWKLGVRMEDPAFPKKFTEAGRPGTYLRIVEEGEVGAGDAIEVVERPDHDLTVGDVFRIHMRDRHEAARLLAIPQLSEDWKAWAARQK